MNNLFLITSQAWDIVKIILGAIFGVFGIEFYRRFTGKRKESLEIAKLYKEGSNLELQVRTNIDSIIEEKTKSLQEEILRLSNTIINLATRATGDRKVYTDRISDLETKIDSQIERNRNMEDDLQKEIKVRQDCLFRLRQLQERVYELEKASPSISPNEKNNPKNKNNIL